MTDEKDYMLVPKDLNEGKSLSFQCDFAVICFCPLPKTFLEYKHFIHTEENDRLFTHVKSSNIIYCFHEGFTFMVLSEIYGGPVSAATLEDLNHYNIRKIYAFGFAGALNDKFDIGDNVRCTSAVPNDGVSKYYIGETFMPNEHLMPIENFNLPLYCIYPTCSVWTIDHFYRQTRKQVDEALKLGCQIVNMDTSHVFAVCNKLSMICVYFATITDTYSNTKKRKNCLSEAITGKNTLLMDNQTSLIRNIIPIESLVDMSFYLTRLHQLVDSDSVCKSHDVQHFVKVYENAQLALESRKESRGKSEQYLSGFERKAILLAALLHDVDDKKLFPKSINNFNCRKILFEACCSDKFVSLVVEMINLVSFSKHGDSVPANIKKKDQKWKLIPRYADRLEALGLTGIKRCYQFTKTLKRPIILEDTPRPKTLEELEQVLEEYKGEDNCFITHFYVKLLMIYKFPICNAYLVPRGIEEGQIMIDFILKFHNKPNDVSDEEFINNYLSKKV